MKPALNLAASASYADPPTVTVDDPVARTLVLELYREHSRRLICRLTRQTGCSEVARELTQEVFLRLLRTTPARLSRIDRPEAYLWQISKNLVRDWGRTRALKERARPTLELAYEEQRDQIEILESRDALRRSAQTICKLKPKTREIFLAHRIDGLTYAEIANRTGLSVKGVEKQMSKGIAALRRRRNRG